MRYSSITHNKDIFTPLIVVAQKQQFSFRKFWPKKISMPKLYYENKNIKNNILPGVISRTKQRTAAALLHLYHVMSATYICIYRVVDLSMCGRTDVQRCRRYMSVFVDKTYHFLLFYDSKKLLKQANSKQIQQQQQRRRLAPASQRYNKNNNQQFCCRLLST